MTRRCEVTGMLPMAGNNVSHANNKTKRRFLPNLHKRRFWHPGRNQFVRLRVSARGIRMIDKYGLEEVLSALESGRKFKKPKNPVPETGKPGKPGVRNRHKPVQTRR